MARRAGMGWESGRPEESWVWSRDWFTLNPPPLGQGNGQSQDAVGALGGGGWVQRTTEWVRKAIDTVVIFF